MKIALEGFQRTLEGKPSKKTVRDTQVGPVGPTYRRAGHVGSPVSLSLQRRFSIGLGFASTSFFQVSLIRELKIDAPPIYTSPCHLQAYQETLIKSFSQDGRNPNHPQSSTIF